MKNDIRLYRKRYIPEETVYLKDDKILKLTDSLIITKWNCLKPRKDIHHGISAYFINNNIKVSKEYDEHCNLVYWYCDIIHTEKNSEDNSIVFHDLLVDVIIYENGTVKVVDTEEIAEVMEKNSIDVSMIIKAMRSLGNFLNIVYSGGFSEFQDIINNAEGSEHTGI